MGFNCSRCGLCCQSVGKLVENVKQTSTNTPILNEIRNFPYSYDESGRCEKLSLNNECTVYESRPDMCNVEKFHEKYFQEYSQDEFFKMNERQCNILKADMEKNKIVEGSKIIAAFMKFPVSEENGDLVWYDYDGAKEVLYHSSWNWLMPVIQKVAEIHTAHSYKYPAGYGENILFLMGINLFNASKDIEWVFYQTVRVIKWCNENVNANY